MSSSTTTFAIASATCIRVDDLAAGHLAALKVLNELPDTVTVNLGTGRPYSVLEMINAFAAASGQSVSYEISSRHKGDLPEYYAEPSLAKKLFGWEAKHDIDRMCADARRLAVDDPFGFCRCNIKLQELDLL